QVKAIAEQGIVISNSSKGTWSNTADGAYAAASLVPTSTPVLATPTWVHAMSTNADEAQPNQDVANYTTVTPVWTNAETYTGASATKVEGIGYVDFSTVDANKNSFQADEDTPYILLNTFYIRSAADVLTSTNLYINDVTVTSTQYDDTEGEDVTHAFNKLDNALRVLIVLTESSTGNPTHAFLYAPVYNQASGTTTTSYTWKSTTPVKARYASAQTDSTEADYDAALVGVDVATGITTIPNTPESAIKVQVYMYFEGEDLNLKSTNIATIPMNDLHLTINFGTTATH
ncbi:MAG: hypothetical protein IJT70_07195, partial [Clostridia bacterium]|nr:hypothetical protein [Clostridia bacterium]